MLYEVITAGCSAVYRNDEHDAMDLTLLYGVAFGTTLSIVTLLWMVSVAIRDASIIDIFWGTLFVAMGWRNNFV